MAVGKRKESDGSLPAWECGLKCVVRMGQGRIRWVTPCVGVWIEMNPTVGVTFARGVTPCVGVWIEITDACKISIPSKCHSLSGSVD